MEFERHSKLILKSLLFTLIRSSNLKNYCLYYLTKYHFRIKALQVHSTNHQATFRVTLSPHAPICTLLQFQHSHLFYFANYLSSTFELQANFPILRHASSAAHLLTTQLSAIFQFLITSTSNPTPASTFPSHTNFSSYSFLTMFTHVPFHGFAIAV